MDVVFTTCFSVGTTTAEPPLQVGWISITFLIGAGRILKVEGHSGGSNILLFRCEALKKIFGAPHFSVVPTQFLMELGAQPSKLNNSNCHF